MPDDRGEFRPPITQDYHVKVQYIQMLVAIADAGTIRSAAEKLGKSQPALTKALREAEQDLGVSLFTRSPRGVVLTKWGERVISRARTIASEMGRLDEDIKQLQGEQIGTINIALSPLAAIHIIPAALANFRQKYPKIQVRLSSGLFQTALKPLREGRLDLLIGPIPPASMSHEISIEYLIETQIGVITAANSPLLKVRSLRDLADAHWVMIGGHSGPGEDVHRIMMKYGIDGPPALTISESYMGALAIVASLGAVTTFPLRVLDAVQKGWDVALIPIKESISPVRIGLMTRSGHPLTPATETLVNCIRKQINILKS